MAVREKIIRDPFTERLLQVFVTLVSKDAILKKKDFTTAIGMTLSGFYNIEKQHANYPKDEMKRAQTKVALSERWYVNPSFLSTASNTMFYKEPEKVKQPTGQGNVTRLTSVRQLKLYEQQIETYKAKIAELEELLSLVADDPANYVPKIKKTLKKKGK